jgi:hypothetical protein
MDNVRVGVHERQPKEETTTVDGWQTLVAGPFTPSPNTSFAPRLPQHRVNLCLPISLLDRLSQSRLHRKTPDYEDFLQLAKALRIAALQSTPEWSFDPGAYYRW